MQEQVNEKTVALSVKASKLTGKVLAKLMVSAMRQMKAAHHAPRAGNQSLKRLHRTIGGETSSIEVMGRIQSFEKIAKKYQVSYHVEKDNSTTPPKWTVYFKARQERDMMAAFTEYAKKTLSKAAEKPKPSILDKLRKLKEQMQRPMEPDKHRNRGEHAR